MFGVWYAKEAIIAGGAEKYFPRPTFPRQFLPILKWFHPVKNQLVLAEKQRKTKKISN